VGVLGFLIISLIAAGVVWFREPLERFRSAGLLIMIGGTLALALAIGWARGMHEGGGLAHYYLVFSLPGLLAAYMVWRIYHTVAGARLIQILLFGVACAMLPLNVQYGLETARSHHGVIGYLERDLSVGVPAVLLAERYGAFLAGEHLPPETVAEQMRGLHRAGVGPFRALRDTNPELPVDTRITLGDTGFKGLFLANGWHDPDGAFGWTTREGRVYFRLSAVEPLRMRMWVKAQGNQTVTIKLNDEVVGTYMVRTEPALIEVDLSAALLRGRNRLVFSSPDARNYILEGENFYIPDVGVGIAWVEFVRSAPAG
jgi:hypothetical protein